MRIIFKELPSEITMFYISDGNQIIIIYNIG